MQNEDRLKAMLSDLGRSTLRGIRKCPKCGTYNGIRGLSCKNKACDAVFKEAGEKRKQSMEVAKLHTGLPTQVFSVRVRDKGPDYRGFVQLPLCQPNLNESDSNYLNQISALCFVESCQRLFNTNILKCHEKQGMSNATCQHIQSAMKCCADAQVLPLDREVLKSLHINRPMKDAIWQLALETPGPLVQRVSKTIMVVKCKVTSKHPLGFLHVTFYPSTKLKENNFTCACTPKNQPKAYSDVFKNCVHYYSCIVAFASNAKCVEEFSSFIIKEKVPEEQFSVEISAAEVVEVEEPNELVTLLGSEIEPDTVDSVLPKDIMLPDIAQDFDRLSNVEVENIASELETGLVEQTFESVIIKPEDTSERKLQKRKKEFSVKRNNETGKRLLRKDIRKQFQLSEETLDENKVQFSFIEWLSSVTERINQSMRYQFNGKSEVLVFQAPHAFFDCFLERLMIHAVIISRKKLPNLVSSRKKSSPLDSYYNYTWHISSTANVKAIFDTPLVFLDLRREIILKADGTYDDLDQGDLDDDLISRKDGENTIRELDYKAYLKIGKMKSDPVGPCVLSFNWIPNVLPVSKIGELRITLEYGSSSKERCDNL